MNNRLSIAMIFQWFFMLMTLTVGWCIDFICHFYPFMWFHPNLMLLILLYWLVHKPWYINVGWAFIWGIIVDLSYGTLIGEHAFIFILLSYTLLVIRSYFSLSSNRNQQPLFNTSQSPKHAYIPQIIVIALLLLAYHLFFSIKEIMIHPTLHPLLTINPIITSLLLWPILLIVLNKIRIN